VQRLHNHGFYLYGVVVGLAIREALTRSAPVLVHPLTAQPWMVRLEALRLVVFLLAISCFYFGAGVYFDKVHLNELTAQKYQTKSYGMDFASGLIHFLIFFAWALTIGEYVPPYRFGISPFLFFLSAVFLYDLVWLAVNHDCESVQEIKMWALMSAVVFVLATVVFFACRTIWQNDLGAEELAFVVYLLYLIGDAVELFGDRPFFLPLIKKLLPNDGA
jgi:hypothetical protein